MKKLLHIFLTVTIFGFSAGVHPALVELSSERPDCSLDYMGNVINNGNRKVQGSKIAKQFYKLGIVMRADPEIPSTFTFTRKIENVIPGSDYYRILHINNNAAAGRVLQTSRH